MALAAASGDTSDDFVRVGGVPSEEVVLRDRAESTTREALSLADSFRSDRSGRSTDDICADSRWYIDVLGSFLALKNNIENWFDIQALVS